MAAVGAGLVDRAPYGRRGGGDRPLGPYGRRGDVAVPLGPVWSLWGRRQSPGLFMAAVGTWPVPKARLVADGWWPFTWAQYDCRGGVGGHLGPVWPKLGRGQSPEPLMAAVGAWPVRGARLAVMEACPVPLSPDVRREGMAGPLSSVWLPWGRVRSPGPCMAAVWAQMVPRAPYGCRESMVGHLGPVWRPWGRGQAPAPRMAVVLAWPVP